MLSLTNEELTNIYGGKYKYSTLPNFNNYIKLFKFIFKTIKSWF